MTFVLELIKDFVYSWGHEHTIVYFNEAASEAIYVTQSALVSHGESGVIAVVEYLGAWNRWRNWHAPQALIITEMPHNGLVLDF